MCLPGGEGVARALVKHMFSFAMQSLIIDNSLSLSLCLPPAWGCSPHPPSSQVVRVQNEPCFMR